VPAPGPNCSLYLGWFKQRVVEDSERATPTERAAYRHRAIEILTKPTCPTAPGARRGSMRRLAERLGIRAPSIYKHLPDRHALAGIYELPTNPVPRSSASKR
jgi:hypothetical protein